MATTIQLRRGSASAWAAANPVLRAGEPGVALDTQDLKIGDGVTPWTGLAALGDVDLSGLVPITRTINGFPLSANIVIPGPDLSGYVGTSDARLSDARVPLAHTQAFSTITGLPSTLAGYGITDGGSGGGAWDGSPIATTLTGAWLQNTQPNSEINNGSFQIYSGQASNLPNDARADDLHAIGWNIDNAVAGAGSAKLMFETHCAETTGCPVPGQSETYFEMDDGHGSAVRPLGFFQKQGTPAYIQAIARVNDWSFFDPTQVTPLLIVRGSQEHTIYGSLSQGLGADTDWLIQSGVSLIRLNSSGAVVVAPGGSDVVIGTPGEAPVAFPTNHFRMSAGTIDALNGKAKVALGSGADNCWWLKTSDTGNPDGISLEPFGVDANVHIQIKAKGTGAVIINNNRGQFGSFDGSLWASAGEYWFSNSAGYMQVVLRAGPSQSTNDIQRWQTNGGTTIARVKSDGTVNAVGYEVAGVAGATGSGSTITAVNGIVTVVSGGGSSVPTTRTVNGHALSADVTVTKADVGLSAVENTALSAWAGSATLTTLGTLASLAVSGAAATVNRDAIAATATDGLVLQNATPATVGVPVQLSPQIRLRGSAWSSGGPQTNTQDWAIDVVPVNGVATNSSLRVRYILNSVGSGTQIFSVDKDGNGLFKGVLCLNNQAVASAVSGLNLAAGDSIAFGSTRSLFSSPANGQFVATNAAANAGVGLDFATDAILKVRTRAQTGDASLSALNLVASGYIEGTETTAPAAGAVNTGRLYFEDNGSGKTRLMVIFNTGAAQQIAIQP